ARRSPYASVSRRGPDGFLGTVPPRRLVEDGDRLPAPGRYARHVPPSGPPVEVGQRGPKSFLARDIGPWRSWPQPARYLTPGGCTRSRPFTVVRARYFRRRRTAGARPSGESRR